jgi:mono/diheme cytochrome c family protein
MFRAAAELAVYGVFAVLLTAASLSPGPESAASSASAVSATPPRGEQLFRAKGCIGCHTHAAVSGARMQIGPDLTDLAARAADRVAGLDADAYVRQSLRTPSAFIVPGYTSVAMPDLQLTDAEIDALVAFLLAR